MTYTADAWNQQEHGHYLFQFFGHLMREAHSLAHTIGVNFNYCVKMAYTTIHFRSGEIVDGVFVKRVPQVTIIIPTDKLELPVDKLIQEVVEYTQRLKIKFFKVEFNLEAKEYAYC